MYYPGPLEARLLRPYTGSMHVHVHSAGGPTRVLKIALAVTLVYIVLLLVAGIVLIGPATAFYIGADFGAGPRDTLMLVGARRTRFRVGIVRGTLELCALIAGILLGGTFGAGTVLFALLVGPIVEASFAVLARTPLAIA